MDEVSFVRATVDWSILVTLIVLAVVGAVGGAIFVWRTTTDRTPSRLLRCATGAAMASLATLTSAYIGAATMYLAYAMLARSLAASSARVLAGGLGLVVALALIFIELPVIARVGGHSPAEKGRLAPSDSPPDATH